MKTVSLRLVLICTFPVYFFAHGVHAARLLEGNPANYRQLLSQLGPSDTLQLRSGEYRQGLPVHYLNGQLDKPIIITGPEKGERPVFLGRPDRVRSAFSIPAM